MTLKLLFILMIYHSIIYETYAACDCSVSVVFASPTKAVGTEVGSSYQSDTTDPLGPWSNNSVCFEGTNLGDLTTFDYLITCTESCYIIDITIEGIAWFTTTLSIYNSDKSNLLGQIERNDKNTFQQYTVPTTIETYSTQWRFTDTTAVCCFRYRHSITMTTKTISETFAPTAPPTATTLSPTVAPITPISLPVYSNQCDCSVSLVFASPRFPIGSTSMSYPSQSTNPLSIWIGESVKFQGTIEGNVTTFDYQIDCNIPCWIQDLTIQGIAWFTTTLSVYNGNKSILLGEINKNDENTFQTYTIDMSSNEQYLTQFRVIEKTYICCWRYRSLINITAIPITDSPTRNPFNNPSNNPSVLPSYNPSVLPSHIPTYNPSYNPTFNPTTSPFQIETLYPTKFPTLTPTLRPSYNPSVAPTKKPTNDGRTNDETTFSPDPSNDQEYTANAGSDNLSNYIIIGVGAVCLCCCIICIIYVLKYKQKKQKVTSDHEKKGTTNGNGINMGIVKQMEVCSRTSSNNFSPYGNTSFNFAQTNETIIDDAIHQINTPRSITNYANEMNIESDIEEGAIFTIPTNNENSNKNEIEMTNITTPNGYENHGNNVEKLNNMITAGYENENENVPSLGDDEFIIEGDDHEFVGNEIMDNVNGVTVTKQEQVQENDDEDMDVLDMVNATPM